MQIIAALLTVVAPPPIAVARPPGIAVPSHRYRSHGEFDYSAWTAARAGRGPTPELMLGVIRAWIRAYFTAFNLYGPDRSGNILGAMPFAQVDTALDLYCTKQPPSKTSEAMPGLIVSLSRRHPVTEPSPAPSTGQAPAQRARQVTFHFTQSCRSWNGAKSNAAARAGLIAAVGGFFTAYNLWAPEQSGDVIGTFNFDATVTSLDAYCADERHAVATGLMRIVLAKKPATRTP